MSPALLADALLVVHAAVVVFVVAVNVAAAATSVVARALSVASVASRRIAPAPASAFAPSTTPASAGQLNAVASANEVASVPSEVMHPMRHIRTPHPNFRPRERPQAARITALLRAFAAVRCCGRVAG